jgi:hypothetical protein
MDFLSLFITSFLIHSSINVGHLSFFSITFKICASSITFPISSEALCYETIVCCQSLRKYVTLFLMHILHYFQSLFKRFSWSLLQFSFWNKFVFHTINLLYFELNSYYLLLRPVFHCFLLLCRVFVVVYCCIEFSTASKFSVVVYYCAEFSTAPNFMPLIYLLRRVSCCYLFLRTVQKSLFSFVAQRLFLSFVVKGYCSLLHCAEAITIHCCTPIVDAYEHHDNSSMKKKECKKRESREV